MTRDDALEIWTAGVQAVDPVRLVRQAVALKKDGSDWLFHFKHSCFGSNSDETGFSSNDYIERLTEGGRLIVIGMGKASGRMAESLAQIVRPLFLENRLSGWINVPDNCVEPIPGIELFGARPAARNEPTDRGVFGSRKIVDLVEQAGPKDLILCLVSGGGSALLPLPDPEISLAEKLEVTRFLAAAGANIEELNTVRKELSQLKGGGLKRICRGKRLISLVLSDVLGDPIDVIASGATVDNTTGPQDALNVAEKFRLADHSDLQNVVRRLREKVKNTLSDRQDHTGFDQHYYLIIGNNETAVEAAAQKARDLGYHPLSSSARSSEGLAEEVGLTFYDRARRIFFDDRDQRFTDCLIEGGEPVVKLVSERDRGRGGRNQQLILAALIHALHDDSQSNAERIPVILSGGTDGEDGPTEAAGAWFDAPLLKQIQTEMTRSGLDPNTYLQRNDAWHFFKMFNALINTGPTGTNVCDLRIALKDHE